jgi:hypothetical protein
LDVIGLNNLTKSINMLSYKKKREEMKIGDLVKLKLSDDDYEVGLIIEIDDRTMPEQIWIKGLDGRVYSGWDDECEVLNDK